MHKSRETSVHKLPLVVISWVAVFFVGGCAKETPSVVQPSSSFSETLVVAGGCFWCVESDFEKLPSVGDVRSGYSGGASDNPTYRNHADHLEVVEVPYDPSRTSYRELLVYFLRHIDPLDAGGQFCDRGHSYTTAIFYQNNSERAAVEAVLADAEAELGEPLATVLLERQQFWLAEDYHQDYYKKNPIRYRYYRSGCGRDARVKAVWGK